MEHRIYEARTINDSVIEISFFTGEVKEIDVKRLALYADKFSELSQGDIHIDNPKVSDNSKTLLLPVQIKGQIVDYTIDSDLLFDSGITVESRQIDNINVQLAGRLVAVREIMGMTQKGLEAASGIHQADISRIERGLGNPSLDTIVRLAEAMKHKVRIEILPDLSLDETLQYDGDYAQFLPPYKKQGDYSVRDIKNLPKDAAKELELVDGVIYKALEPSSIQQDILIAIHRIISDYVSENEINGKVLISPFSLRDSYDDSCVNDLKPSVAVTLDENVMVSDSVVIGGLDFVCEFAPMHVCDRELEGKKSVYQSLGVSEYWLLDTSKRQLTVYSKDSSFENPMVYVGDEIVPVRIFGDELKVNLRGLWRFCEN